LCCTILTGGAIVLSPDGELIKNVGETYAGRASSSPIVDLFITLLSMGLNGYKRLLAERMDILESFPKRFEEVANKYGERLLTCPSNTISFGITLDHLARPIAEGEDENDYLSAVSLDISKFGGMLFSRCVSGTRVVPRGSNKTIGGYDFAGFGSSVEDYPHAYMTAACAIGVSRSEVDDFFIRLDKTFKEFKKTSRK
jgi:O-phospho-L-seryl-tRNASec:L-selenocysteinyl-tRNA synthase